MHCMWLSTFQVSTSGVTFPTLVATSYDELLLHYALGLKRSMIQDAVSNHIYLNCKPHPLFQNCVYSTRS